MLHAPRHNITFKKDVSGAREFKKKIRLTSRKVEYRYLMVIRINMHIKIMLCVKIMHYANLMIFIIIHHLYYFNLILHFNIMS